MKTMLVICLLIGFYSTTAVAQQHKSRRADYPKGRYMRHRAGNADGEFAKRETATVRRIEKKAHRIERQSERYRDANNDRRRVDARRAEKSFAKKNS